MTALLPESILEYMIRLARGQVPKETLRYRINFETVSAADLKTEESFLNSIDRCNPCSVWMIDSTEADKMLRRQYQARVNDNLPVPHVLQPYIAEATPVRRGHGRPLDRVREFENEKLRAKVRIAKRFMKMSPRRFPPVNDMRKH